jgi:hypothetical protein
MGYWQVMVQHRIQWKLNMTEKWCGSQRKYNCTEWLRSTTVWRGGRVATIHMLLRRNLALKARTLQSQNTFQILKRHSEHLGQSFDMMVLLNWHCWKDYHESKRLKWEWWQSMQWKREVLKEIIKRRTECVNTFHQVLIVAWPSSLLRDILCKNATQSHVNIVRQTEV